MHLAGAITSDCADKAARFLQLCEAFRLPVLFLCDTPGIMVGPDAETTALVRHASRLFLAGAALTVPFMTVVLRKGYGLGAQAMAGGSFRAPLMTVAWPTGEFGGMGLEGAVKLAYRKELEAIEDADARAARFDAMVAETYERGTALNTATYFEVDDVIDPAATRALVAAVILHPEEPPRGGSETSLRGLVVMASVRRRRTGRSRAEQRHRTARFPDRARRESSTPAPRRSPVPAASALRRR